MHDSQEGCLEALQARLEEAAAEVKATTTATRNKNKLKVSDEIKTMQNCRNPLLKSRTEFDDRVGAPPRGNIVRRPVVKKLWINGRACEDREEWMVEVGGHCERCCDDKDETSEVQAEIREQRYGGDSLIARQGRKVHITIATAL